MIGKGFLGNQINIIVNRDNFLNHHSHIYMERKDSQVIRAYEATLNYKTKNVMSTLGEFFEREVLINTNKLKNKELTAVSMIDGNIKNIDTAKVVFDKCFVDSCGMASHILSDDIVKTAFLEFFERQCLIFNYLSRSLGVKLDIKNCSEVLIYNNYIKNFVDRISYFNISLDNEIYVVIALALGEDRKAIGLGTDIDCKTAILKAQKEILQNFAVECSKYNYQDIGFDINEYSEKDLYHTYFDNLSSLDIEKKYKYLENSPIEIVSNKVNNTLNLNNLLQKINKNYGIEPYIVFINTKRLVNHLKVIKVIDFNWFPHMRPEFYNDDIYSYVEKRTNIILQRDVNIIPFP